MGSIFELAGKLQEFRDGIEKFSAVAQEAVASVPNPEWLAKAIQAEALVWVLTQLKAQGPPDGFSEALKMPTDEAEALYRFVLESAIRRQQHGK